MIYTQRLKGREKEMYMQQKTKKRVFSFIQRNGYAILLLNELKQAIFSWLVAVSLIKEVSSVLKVSSIHGHSLQSIAISIDYCLCVKCTHSLIQHICFIAQTNGRGLWQWPHYTHFTTLFIELLEHLVTIWSFYTRCACTLYTLDAHQNDLKWRIFFSIIFILDWYSRILSVRYKQRRLSCRQCIVQWVKPCLCHFQSEWLMTQTNEMSCEKCALTFWNHAWDGDVLELTSWFEHYALDDQKKSTQTTGFGECYKWIWNWLVLAKCEWLSTFTVCLVVGFWKTTDNSEMFFKLLLR